MQLSLRSVAVACLAFLAPMTSAQAVELWPSAGDDLQPITWTGFIVAPYFGYETLHLQGNGSNGFSDPSGWRVGVELDYDYQIGDFVVGIAGDGFFTWYDGNGPGTYSSKLNDYGTLRMRLGYAMGRWLIFGTGGYAVGDLEVDNGAASESKTLNGWTAGGGVEWVWNNNFTLRGEVAHIALNQQTFAILPAGNQELGANLDLFKIDFITRF
jgi:outer membrane immunogenic protein